MSITPRIKVLGKDATEEELVKFVVNLHLGNEDNHQKPKTPTQIAIEVGCSRRSVYNYLDKASEMQLLTKQKFELKNAKNETIKEVYRYIKPEKTLQEEFFEFSKDHPIVNDPIIVPWRQDLLTRKGGEPIQSWQVRINSVDSICNTCRITPNQLRYLDRRQLETIMKNYAEKYQQGLVKSQQRFNVEKKNKNLLAIIDRICKEQNFSSALYDAIDSKLQEQVKNKSIQGAIYTKVQGLRDFVGFYGITFKRGIGGILSQKIVGHAKYADVRLLDSEFEKANDYIISKWGLDSNVYRWFWVGVESCARFNALYNMDLEFFKHFSEKLQKYTYLLTAFESKTKHIKGGKWTKYITRSETQQSLDALKARHGIKIWESKSPKTKFATEMRDAMFEIFLHLAKTNLYFYQHGTHVLRHLGAHYWLAKGNYKNHVVVAKIGGWHTVDEMIRSYGEFPPEKLLEAVEEMQQAAIV